MPKHILLLIILFTVSCEEENRPPQNINIIYPDNNSENIETSFWLRWESTDPENDDLAYTVYFDTVPDPTLYTENIHVDSIFIENLEYEKVYYWYITVSDGEHSTTSEINSFTSRLDYSKYMKFLPVTVGNKWVYEGERGFDGGEPTIETWEVILDTVLPNLFDKCIRYKVKRFHNNFIFNVNICIDSVNAKVYFHNSPNQWDFKQELGDIIVIDEFDNVILLTTEIGDTLIFEETLEYRKIVRSSDWDYFYYFFVENIGFVKYNYSDDNSYTADLTLKGYVFDGIVVGDTSATIP